MDERHLLYSQIITNYEIIFNDEEFEANYTPNINLLERLMLNLERGIVGVILVFYDYENMTIEILNQESYNLLKTFFDFIELESYPLENLKILKECDNRLYSKLSCMYQRKIRDAAFFVKGFDISSKRLGFKSITNEKMAELCK